MAPLSSQTSASPIGHLLSLDEDGFLIDPRSWSPQTAQVIAAMQGIDGLQPAHWAIIEYIREYHQRFGAMPLMRRVCRTQNMSADTVKQLFGNCLSAWRIAGLPHPGEEAKSYLS